MGGINGVHCKQHYWSLRRKYCRQNCSFAKEVLKTGGLANIYWGLPHDIIRYYRVRIQREQISHFVIQSYLFSCPDSPCKFLNLMRTDALWYSGEKLWIQNKVSCNMASGLIRTYYNTGYVTDSLGLRFFFPKIVGNNTWFTRVLKGI